MPSFDALGPFLKRMEVCLSKLSHQELKHRLLSHARSLSAPQREAFLELLEAKPGPRKPSTSLLDEIDGFVEELESGAYFEDLGWDRNYRVERAFGDESWAPTMDALFAEAARAFLAEDWSVAASAYGRLLGALDLEEAFSGTESPEQMLQTDLTEARIRYFRAVFEAAPPAERATTLRVALDELGSEAWATFDLAAMSDAHELPISDLESFLPSWTATLEAMQLEPDYLGRYRACILAEATFVAEGLGGLARLARAHGDRLSLYFERWLDELIRAGRLEEALDAAREGVERALEEIAAAKLADRLADLARSTGKPDLEVVGCRWAWRKQPSARRFLRLHRSMGSQDPCGYHLATTELEAAGRGEYRLPEHLSFMLKLLAEDLAAVLVTTAKASPVGWTYGSTMGSVAVPFLLVGSSGVEDLPEATVLASLWSDLESRGLHSLPDEEDGLAENVDRRADLTWDPLLRAAIARVLSTPGSCEKALAAATEAVGRRIETIVSGGIATPTRAQPSWRSPSPRRWSSGGIATRRPGGSQGFGRRILATPPSSGSLMPRSSALGR